MLLLSDLLMVVATSNVEISDRDGKIVAKGTQFKDVFPLGSCKVLRIDVGDYDCMYVMIDTGVKKQ